MRNWRQLANKCQEGRLRGMELLAAGRCEAEGDLLGLVIFINQEKLKHVYLVFQKFLFIMGWCSTGIPRFIALCFITLCRFVFAN